MPYTGKGTNTGRALQAVLDNGLDKNGDRPGVLNQVFIERPVKYVTLIDSGDYGWEVKG